MTTIATTLAHCTAQLTQAGAPYELAAQSVDGIPCRLFVRAPVTLRDALNQGRQHGDAIFLQYEDERWSFRRFFEQVDAIAWQLVHRYGIQKGDRIAIAMRNYPEWMTAFVATAQIGAVVVPLNSWGQRAELEYALSDADARVVFVDPQRLAYIEQMLSPQGTRAIVARCTETVKTPGAESLEQFLAGAEGKAAPDVDIQADDPAMIMYTSGTTGNPKGALSNQRNMTQAIFAFEFAATSSAMANPKAIEAMIASGNAPNSLLAVPLFHVSGCYAMFLLSLRGGRKIVMMYKWNPEKAIDLIERERITTLSAAPSMIMEVLEHPHFHQRDTRSLFALGAGGAATPPRLRTLIEEHMPVSYPGTGYGMTESNACCASCTGEVFRYKPGNSGYLSPIMDFKTCDEAGNTLPTGSTGEIWLRGPTVVRGYWKKPEATASSFVDGWLATGDIGYIDAENFVFIVDRAKDIIIRGGENISAAEVEACLHDHPQVREVAAFGVAHDILGEELAVAIRPREGTQPSESDIRSFVSARLAGFKVPSRIFFAIDELPRNATGKLLKKVIREQLCS